MSMQGSGALALTPARPLLRKMVLDSVASLILTKGNNAKALGDLFAF